MQSRKSVIIYTNSTRPGRVRSGRELYGRVGSGRKKMDRWTTLSNPIPAAYMYIPQFSSPNPLFLWFYRLPYFVNRYTKSIYKTLEEWYT